MTEIFIYGCSCGLNNTYVQRVKAYDRDVAVYNTRRSKPSLQRHADMLQRAGMGTETWQAIVVEYDGRKISLLKEW